jgi:hypothetical protein
MTKNSRYEREKRAAANERIRGIEARMASAIPPEVASAFAREVEQARAYVPPPRVDMATGTQPRPPRPGHEPRKKKEDTRPPRRNG